MSQTRIVIIPPAASMPAPFLTFDEGGRVLQRGSLLLEDPQTTPDVRTVAVAPGADVLVRWLDLPVGGAAQVRAAARWALKDELAGDPERTVVAVAPAARGEETAPRLVAAVSAGLLEAWIDYLAPLGFGRSRSRPTVFLRRRRRAMNWSPPPSAGIRPCGVKALRPQCSPIWWP